MDAYISQVSAAVDWLTVTSVDEHTTRALYDRAVKLTEALSNRREIKSSWAWRGYTGWQIGQLRYGERYPESIAILSGLHCAVFWNLFFPEFPRVTRLDLQVTVEPPTPVPDLAKTVWQNFMLMPKPELCQLKRAYRFTGATDGGQTLYVGKRSSDQMGRLYDKGVQEGTHQPGQVWRYEIEYKKYRAKRVAKEIEARLKQENFNLNSLIISTVYEWFDLRLVPPLFERYNETSLNVELAAQVTSVDRSLNWLATQVRPTIERLIDHGYLKEALDALGIDN